MCIGKCLLRVPGLSYFFVHKQDHSDEEITLFCYSIWLNSLKFWPGCQATVSKGEWSDLRWAYFFRSARNKETPSMKRVLDRPHPLWPSQSDSICCQHWTLMEDRLTSRFLEAGEKVWLPFSCCRAEVNHILCFRQLENSTVFYKPGYSVIW